MYEQRKDKVISYIKSTWNIGFVWSVYIQIDTSEVPGKDCGTFSPEEIT